MEGAQTQLVVVLHLPVRGRVDCLGCGDAIPQAARCDQSARNHHGCADADLPQQRSYRDRSDGLRDPERGAVKAPPPHAQATGGALWPEVHPHLVCLQDGDAQRVRVWEWNHGGLWGGSHTAASGDPR